MRELRLAFRRNWDRKEGMAGFVAGLGLWTTQDAMCKRVWIVVKITAGLEEAMARTRNADR